MNNWKIVCDKVSTTMDLSEMEFEKGVATLILANLGWNEFRGNIKEQYLIEDHAKGYKPDFALFPEGKDEPGIFVELKETGHKQRSKDIKQIRTYMMLENCRFCIYFGEKMELFFIKIDGAKRSLNSVLTLDYNPKNPDGNILLDLINFDTFDEDKLLRFCEDRLAADETTAYFTSEEGRKRLFELMAKDRNLSDGAAKLLPSMLTMPERKAQGVENVSGREAPLSKPEETKTVKTIIHTDIISSFRDFAEKTVGKNTARNYIRHLKGGVSEFFSKIIDEEADSIFCVNNSSELSDCIATLKSNDQFVAANKANRYFLSASLTKYLEYLVFMEGGEVQTSPKPQNHNKTKKVEKGQIVGKGVLFSQEMKQAGGKCQMTYYPESKRYVVNKGSNILDISYDSCGSGARDLREKVKKDSSLCRKEGDLYTLLEDIIMPPYLSSPTGASKFCWGTSRPGPKDWQDEDGKTYPSEWWK